MKNKEIKIEEIIKFVRGEISPNDTNYDYIKNKIENDVILNRIAKGIKEGNKNTDNIDTLSNYLDKAELKFENQIKNYLKKYKVYKINKLTVQRIAVAASVILLTFGHVLYSQITNSKNNSIYQGSYTKNCYDEAIKIYLNDLYSICEEANRKRGAESQLIKELLTMNRFRDYSSWKCNDRKTALICAKEYLKKILIDNNFSPEQNVMIFAYEI